MTAPFVDWRRYEAVLFDLDGVLTPTAVVHRKAWKETFDAVLAQLGDDRPFQDDDYLRHVDGRPRYDGVRTFLTARGHVMPEGSIDDEPGLDTIGAIGNLKNGMFNRVLERDGVTPYPGSVALLDHLDTLGVDIAMVSSSANALPVLRAAGLIERFSCVVDGLVARAEELPGKPDPATFLRAAQRLGVGPDRAVVVEDAESGVEAGRAGGFGLVVGVDREGASQRLGDAGADVVVDDLFELV